MSEKDHSVAVIHAAALNGYAFEPLAGGASAFERVADAVRELPGIGKKAVFGAPGIKPEQVAGLDHFPENVRTEREFLSKLMEFCPPDGGETVRLFSGDAPILCGSLIRKMEAAHYKYCAEFSFADGYPPHIAPELVSADVLPRLLPLCKEQPFEGLFPIIERDINDFIIETEIARIDLRMMRISLCADSRRNTLLLERFMENGIDGSGDAEDIAARIKELYPLARTLPAYFPIQVTDGCPQSCACCAYPLQRGDMRGRSGAANEMSVDDFGRLLDKIESFAGDGIVSLSPFGEPALHSRIPELIGELLRRPALSLIVETSGIGWNEGNLERIAEIAASSNAGKRIDWIVSLDAEDPLLYRRLRGEGYEEARRTAERLHALFPGRCHAQAVRMVENEEDNERFFPIWNERTGHAVIQKYNDYAGILPQRRISDLSPLDRFPCRRLQRELPVLTDGSVPRCLQRAYGDGKILIGDIREDDIETVWERGAQLFGRHCRNEWPDPCSKCDEFYVFNG